MYRGAGQPEHVRRKRVGAGGSGGGEGGGGGIGGREPGRTGGGKRAGSGIYMRAGSGSRNKESNSLLFIAGHYLIKNTSCEVLKFPFNIYQCSKENFGSKKT